MWDHSRKAAGGVWRGNSESKGRKKQMRTMGIDKDV